MHSSTSRQAGFTLIELMIVVAILAILAAIAIPAYQDYLIRTQVMEGFSLSEGLKVAVTEYYYNTGEFPTTEAQAGLLGSNAYAGKYVSRVDALSRPGNILVHFDSTSGQVANKAIDGLQLGFSAITADGSVKWVCTNRNLRVRFTFLGPKAAWPFSRSGDTGSDLEIRGLPSPPPESLVASNAAIGTSTPVLARGIAAHPNCAAMYCLVDVASIYPG